MENTKKESLLKGIKEFAENRRASEINETERKMAELDSYAKKIGALAPRIKDLLEVAQALHENRTYIGKPKCGMIGSYSEFVTDGIRHYLGFYVDMKKSFEPMNTAAGYPYAFGIKGGGCDGKDLEVNERGEIVRGFACEFSTFDKMKKLIKGFDNFEARFYAYVGSLA